MNCEEARHRWHARLDDSRADPHLDSHLASCDACRRYSREIARVVGTLEELHRATQHIVSRRTGVPLSEPSPRLRTSRPMFRRAALAVAAVLAIAMSATLYYRMPDDVEFSVSRTPNVNGNVDMAGSANGAAIAGSPPNMQLGVSLRGVTAERFVVVASPTSHADVHMFRLYPTLREPNKDDPSW